MSTQVHAPITLSGNVYCDDNLFCQTCGMEGVQEVPLGPELKAGDLILYCRLDDAGRSAVYGRHANWGYSGYFKASIYDGKKRRNFRLWGLIDEVLVSYSSQREKHNQISQVIAQLTQLAAHVATWGHRAYELHDASSAPASAAPATAPATAVTAV